MDAWNYIAFGGLERIVIIAAATLIGYWGYRIFASSRGGGLTLMAAAALVLAGALLTTGQHLDRVSETLMASNSAGTVTPLPSPAPAVEPSLEILSPAREARAPGSGLEGLPTPSAPQETASAPSGAERVERIMPLASGQELGGRITSVRSENVTIEWSPEVARRRVISSSREP